MEAAGFAAAHSLVLGLMLLALVNWRFHTWMGAVAGIARAEAYRRLPLWVLNLFVAVIIGWVEAMLLVPLWLQRVNAREDACHDAERGSSSS